MKNLIAIVFLFSSLFANAGRVKEVMMDHEEAVCMKIWGTFQPPYEGALTNTRYVKADPGFYIAMASDVEVYGQPRTITCVSQFVRTGERSVQHKSLKCD